MEEIHTGEALEIAVEGDEPAARCDREGREVGVRPQMMREACGAGQCMEVLVKGGRLHQKLQDRNGKKLPVNNPRLLRTQRIGQYAGMSAKAQKPQRGDAAKSERLCGLFFPIAAGSLVLFVPLVDQGKPDIDIEKIRHLREGCCSATR